MVFSRAWFRQHQRTLLTLLAAPVIGRELRDALAIRRGDVGYHQRIVALYPHAYVVANPDGSFTLDCRTHAKYAKRLQHQLAPLWRAAHAWDRFVANPLVPALNLGFDTLPVSPEAGVIGTTHDGIVYRFFVDETWAVIRVGAGTDQTSIEDQSAIVYWNTATTSGHFAQLRRGQFLFDTAALAGATLTAAVLSLYGVSKQDDSSNSPTLDVYTANPANDGFATAGDFQAMGTTSQTGAPLTYASYSTSVYNDFTLNATGRASISLTGVSKFAIRDATYDVGGATPTWANPAVTGFGCYMADATGTANDPTLLVTFTPPPRPPQIGLFDPLLVGQGWF